MAMRLRLRPEIKVLHKAFEDSGLKYSQLVKMAGVSRRTLYLIFTGKRVPKTSTFESIATALGQKVTVSDMRRSA